MPSENLSDGLSPTSLTAVQQYAYYQAGQCGETHCIIRFLTYRFVSLTRTVFNPLGGFLFKAVEAFLTAFETFAGFFAKLFKSLFEHLLNMPRRSHRFLLNRV